MINSPCRDCKKRLIPKYCEKYCEKWQQYKKDLENEKKYIRCKKINLFGGKYEI
jgi:hypothetical protein